MYPKFISDCFNGDMSKVPVLDVGDRIYSNFFIDAPKCRPLPPVTSAVMRFVDGAKRPGLIFCFNENGFNKVAMIVQDHRDQWTTRNWYFVPPFSHMCLTINDDPYDPNSPTVLFTKRLSTLIKTGQATYTMFAHTDHPQTKTITLWRPECGELPTDNII